jgi:leader peptidase (prepilin peptidase) / N-methyltransferase
MVAVLSLAATAGLLVGIVGPILLRRLPEPLLPDDADDDVRADYSSKISYRSLATVRFATITGLIAAAATALAVITQPSWSWPAWMVSGTVVLLLAAIDASTTWLPTRLVRLGWVLMTLAVLAGLFTSDGRRIEMLIIVGVSALIAGGGYLLLWLITGGRAIAFGDVRLMPLIGAVAGTMGWSGLYWSLLLGSLVGAIYGTVRLVLGRRGPFPYAPALVSGPYAAAVLLTVMR